jgi:hypothetical protein
LYALACVNMKMFAAAVEKSGALSRAGLAAGLAKVGELDLSFPAGPAIFRDASNPTGGQFWRPAYYDNGCTCGKLRDTTWRPEFH